MDEPQQPGRFGRASGGATSWVVAGSAVSGLGAYAFTVLAARALGEEAYAPIGVLWTLQYLAFTVPLISVESYLTRVRSLALDEPASLRGPLARVGGWVAAMAVLTGGVTFLARGPLYAGDAQLAVVAAVIVAAYGAFAVVRGLLAGADRFRIYALGTGGESIIRLVLAVGVLWAVGTTASLAWVMPAGPVLAILWWVADRRRRGAPPLLGTRPWSAPGEAPGEAPREAAGGGEAAGGADAGRYLVTLTVANGCAQTLLAAGPLVIVPLGAGPVEVAVFFVTATFARAPLQFLTGGMLSRVLPPLTRMAAAGQEATLRRVALALAGGAAVAGAASAGLAWVAGPEVVALLFGEGFTPPRLFTVLTGWTVIAMTGCLLLNQISIARGTTGRLVPPWVGGALVAVSLITVVGGTPTDRVAIAVAAAVSVVLAWLTVTSLRPTPPPMP